MMMYAPWMCTQVVLKGLGKCVLVAVLCQRHRVGYRVVRGTR